ncbi:ISL3 family transposase [Nonomuraea bangladeshensis]|uniref:ISL3 family transposase n=1 Tax=Nonomuraea bangladeshensis TaxID=404385 RepID=A0ABV3HAB3_9ACTN
MVNVLFPHLAAVEIEQIDRQDSQIRVKARTRGDPVRCPSCGTVTGKVHGYHQRRLADRPVDGLPVVIELRLRRLVCINLDCVRQTFHEQVPGLAGRYERRTPGATALVVACALALAGRAGAALLATIGFLLSRTSVLNTLMALPEPPPAVPAAIGVDDFAIKRGQRYATVIIDAVTHRCLDVLPDRLGVTFAHWLQQHPGVQLICRDRSTAYAAGARDGAPQAVQCADRWHLLKNLSEAIEKLALAHRGCFRDIATGQGRDEGPTVRRTRSRYAAIHALLGQGVANNEIARRLNLALNTVKKYARAQRVDQLIGGTKRSATLVDPFRDYLRNRRAAEPGVTVQTLLQEIKSMGYQGGSTLLYRYLGQGRAEDAQPPSPSPRRVAIWIMTDPAHLSPGHTARLQEVLDRCLELKQATEYVRTFADLLTQRQGHRLDDWINEVRASDLQPLRSFAEGLLIDHDAVVAGLTLPYSNGPTEGVVNKIKLLKRQMYGRAGLALLRKRMLLTIARN